jgi:hypothetical protein
VFIRFMTKCLFAREPARGDVDRQVRAPNKKMRSACPAQIPTTEPSHSLARSLPGQSDHPS